MIGSLLFLPASLLAAQITISEVTAEREGDRVAITVKGDAMIDPEATSAKLGEGRLYLFVYDAHVRENNRAWQNDVAEGADEIRAHRHKQKVELAIPLGDNGCQGPVELEKSPGGLRALVACDGGPRPSATRARAAAATTTATARAEAAKPESRVTALPAASSPTAVKPETLSSALKAKLSLEPEPAAKPAAKAADAVPAAALASKPAVAATKPASAPSASASASGASPTPMPTPRAPEAHDALVAPNQQPQQRRRPRRRCAAGARRRRLLLLAPPRHRQPPPHPDPRDREPGPQAGAGGRARRRRHDDPRLQRGRHHPVAVDSRCRRRFQADGRRYRRSRALVRADRCRARGRRHDDRRPRSSSRRRARARRSRWFRSPAPTIPGRSTPTACPPSTTRSPARRSTRASSPRTALLSRLFKRGTPANDSPRFEDILEDSFEDQELRRKLALGLPGRVR